MNELEREVIDILEWDAGEGADLLEHLKSINEDERWSEVLTYHVDTLDFYKRNEDDIISLIEGYGYESVFHFLTQECHVSTIQDGMHELAVSAFMFKCNELEERWSSKSSE